MNQPHNIPATLPDEPYPSVAREGWPIVGAFILGAAVLSRLCVWIVGPVGWLMVIPTGLLSLWAIWFFRDPPRRIPADPDAVICPADGVISFVGPSRPPAELGIDEPTAAAMTRISVFMNVFNVHVNRSPVSGVVAAANYRPGKFFNASFDKASEQNERSSLLFRLADGRVLACVQIAGLIARRIVCRAKPGDQYRAGQRFGLIRFGSRVDVYLPGGVEPRVRIGERVTAGETIFAFLQSPQAVPSASPQLTEAR